MAATSVARRDILSLLDKLGAEYTPKITVPRAKAKLKRHIDKKGLPEEMTSNEKATLKGCGIDVPGKAAAKKKTAAKKTATKKTAAKKDSKPAPKKTATKKTARADWMTVAANAVLSSKNMDDAAEKAAKNYLAAGGKETPNNAQNGKLYTSFASKALIAAGVIGLDGKIISKI